MKSQQLIGVVACGGKSTRMGTDKGLLDYFGEPQRYRLYKMLLPFCQSVVLSVNIEQSATVPEAYPSITDLEKYADMGPVTAVLTAFSFSPHADLLVVGCDYPWITEGEINHFLRNITGESVAAAFYNKDDRYEPLLAWYSNACAGPLLERVENGDHSLQRFLVDCHAQKYIPSDVDTMLSADRPEQYEKISRIVKRKKYTQ